MSTFFGLLFTVGTIGIVVALIALARGRLRWARIGSRKAAGYALAGAVVLFFVGAAGAGATTTRPNPPAPAATAPTTTPPTTTPPITSNSPTLAPAPPTTSAAPATTTTTPTPVAAPPPPPRPRTTVAAPPPPPAPAPPPSPLTCSASMSDPQPADYTTTDVIVQTGVAGAVVTTTAHYKTTNTTHQTTAGPDGQADIEYRISDATKYRPVPVDVTVTANGATRSCSTSFTPQ